MINPKNFGVVFEFLRPFYAHRTKSVKGLENIPIKGPAIVVADPHNSSYDPQFIVVNFLRAKTNREVHFITTYKFLKSALAVEKILPGIGAIKFLEKRLGMVLQLNKIERRGILEKARQKLKNGHLIGIFLCGKLAPKNPQPKTGATQLALELKVPIIPVQLKSNIYTRGRFKFIKFLYFHFFSFKKMEIIIKKPVYCTCNADEMSTQTYRHFAQLIFDVIHN